MFHETIKYYDDVFCDDTNVGKNDDKNPYISTYDDKNDKKHLFYKFIIFYIYLFFLLPTLLKKISSYRHSHCKIKVFL